MQNSNITEMSQEELRAMEKTDHKSILKSNIKRAERSNTVAFWLIKGIFYIIVFIAGAFLLRVLLSGIRAYQPEYLSFTPKGVGMQLFNSIYLCILTLLISAPIGVGAGIYMAEYAKEGPALSLLRLSSETLSSLPSVVVGLFGYLVFIAIPGLRWNLLSAALTLSIINIPLIARNCEDAARAVPDAIKKGSYALGASKWQTVKKIVIPSSMSGIATGLVLASGRVFGEAAALLYTAGMSTRIDFRNFDITSPTCPWNPMRPGETLALHIWAQRSEALSPDAAQIADFSAAVLLVAVGFFIVLAKKFTPEKPGDKK